jgi:hypothetical protein
MERSEISPLQFLKGAINDNRRDFLAGSLLFSTCNKGNIAGPGINVLDIVFW